MENLTETREIPWRGWKGFFDGFSRRHRGWLASVEEIGPGIGAMTEARELFFQGIAAGAGRGSAITLSLGKGSDEHLVHPVANPQRVWLETFSNGAEAALEIESAGGHKTILSFRSTMPAEMVDGLVRETPAGARRKR
jgi:hypothetical protein